MKAGKPLQTISTRNVTRWGIILRNSGRFPTSCMSLMDSFSYGVHRHVENLVGVPWGERRIPVTPPNVCNPKDMKAAGNAQSHPPAPISRLSNRHMGRPYTKTSQPSRNTGMMPCNPMERTITRGKGNGICSVIIRVAIQGRTGLHCPHFLFFYGAEPGKIIPMAMRHVSSDVSFPCIQLKFWQDIIVGKRCKTQSPLPGSSQLQYALCGLL